MRIRRTIANFILKQCRFRSLHGSRLARLIQSLLDEIHLQSVRDSNPCKTFRDRKELYHYIQSSIIGGEPVDYLEFGVFQGESIREWTRLNGHKESRYLGFDSFEGLPEDWRPGQSKGHFDVGGLPPDIDDERVSFVKGWFQDTIPAFMREFSVRNRLVVHVDADLYSSAMLALVHLGPLMAKGTLLIFDEFYDRQHEFKALMDWQKVSGRPFRIVAETGNYSKICAELM